MGGLDRLAELIVDTRPNQFDCVATVIAAHHQPGLRKRVLCQFHDLQRRLWIVDADHDMIASPAPAPE